MGLQGVLSRPGRALSVNMFTSHAALIVARSTGVVDMYNQGSVRIYGTGICRTLRVWTGSEVGLLCSWNPDLGREGGFGGLSGGGILVAKEPLN